MTLKVTKQNDLSIVEFIEVDQFTLAMVENVKAELRPLLLKGGCKMIFNLHNITFIDSSGIGCIISLFKTANTSGSILKLCNLTPKVKEIFTLLHLQTLFDITASVESCAQELSLS